MRVTDLPPDYYIKDVRFNQTDAFNAPMHFGGDASTPLEVLLSPNGGRIDGTVIDEKRNLMAGIEAVLIPDRRRDRTDLYKTQRRMRRVTSRSGAFPRATTKYSRGTASRSSDITTQSSSGCLSKREHRSGLLNLRKNRSK